MFGALIFLAHDISERSFILGLAVLQLVEGRIPFLTTLWGRTISVVLQLIIVWLLDRLYARHQSQYYLMLLLPLVSTASYLGVAGTRGRLPSRQSEPTCRSFCFSISKKCYIAPED